MIVKDSLKNRIHSWGLKFEQQLHSIMLYNLVIRYRLHISALFLAISTLFYLPTATRYGFTPLIAFYLWHQALYTYNRYSDRLEDQKNNPSEAATGKHGSVTLYSSFIFIAAGALLLIITGFTPVYYIACLPLLFLYGQKLPGNFRIKNIFLIKNLYAASICWALPFLLIDLCYHETLRKETWQLAFVIFCMTLGYEILWDIKDIHGDRLSGIRTIPATLGIKLAKAIILGCLLINFLYKLKAYEFLDIRFTIFFLFYTAIAKEDTPHFVFHSMILVHLSVATLNIFQATS